jgi:glycosyltransferase involved in cell wall biosynthesis
MVETLQTPERPGYHMTKALPVKKKILLLWSPLADYTVACFKKLSEREDIELYIIYRPAESNAPYHHFEVDFFKKVFIYEKEAQKQLDEFCMSLKPDVILMASWNYPFYMSVARRSRKRGTYVISTFDGQWRATLKQKIGILVSPFFLKPAIDNFFVPGDRQAVFARKLGYKNPLLGFYSAYTERFKDITRHHISRKFLFVGRLVPIKGIVYLVEAYKEYRRSVRDPWELIIVGKGHLSAVCKNVEGIVMKDFVQPKDLPAIYSEATCLVLPSFFEPWALVIHEAVTSGLPVICSHECGGLTMFVRDGQNGYIINTDTASLVSAMKKMSAKTNEELREMSDASRLLGSLWTTDTWTDYVYKYICSHSRKIMAGV